jgi:hypothetical protein
VLNFVFVLVAFKLFGQKSKHKTRWTI